MRGTHALSPADLLPVGGGTGTACSFGSGAAVANGSLIYRFTSAVRVSVAAVPIGASAARGGDSSWRARDAITCSRTGGDWAGRALIGRSAVRRGGGPESRRTGAALSA